MEHLTIFQGAYDNFEIEHCKRQEPSNMLLYHYHTSYEIYYLLSGSRNYFIKDRTYGVEKGDIVLINRNDLHKTTYRSSLTHERILINFDETFISGLLPFINDIDVFQPFHSGIHIIKLDKSEQSAVEQWFFKIMKEVKERTPGAETSVRLTLLEMLIFFARKSSHPENGNGAGEHINQAHEKVSEIVKYINSNYMERLTLQSISERFYISPCYLSRLFKKVTGFTFVEYLNSIRIKEAQRLLQESDLDIGEIADRTGYESSTHFGRVFKEITGFSPLRFKKMYTCQ